jgi:hypothetical protein
MIGAPGSSVEDRVDHPVVQVAHTGALAYCAGARRVHP